MTSIVFSETEHVKDKCKQQALANDAEGYHEPVKIVSFRVQCPWHARVLEICVANRIIVYKHSQIDYVAHD